MEFKNLQEYVERELGHKPEPVDFEERFIWLIQGYHSMKGELSSEDLTYINTIDPKTYDYLDSIVGHYELHIMGGPGIEYEIEECYNYFSYDAAISDMENFTKEGLYVRLISVDTDCLFDNQTDIDNFEEVKKLLEKIPVKDLLKLYNEIKIRYNNLDNLAKRLQDDYNDGETKPFVQDEQDRLDICAILDLFDEIKMEVK